LAFDILGNIYVAANQIGVLKQALVLDASTEEQTIIFTLANPHIKEVSKEKTEFEEGCLSFPGITEKIYRPKHIIVQAKDWDGSDITIDTKGLLAVVLQHEIDHLNGVTFIDRMSAVKKMLHNKELKTLKKEFNGNVK